MKEMSCWASWLVPIFLCQPLVNRISILCKAKWVVFSLLELAQALIWSFLTVHHLRSTIENPAEASFFEPFEAAHSLRDLSGSIAKKLGVTAPPVRMDSQAKYGALARGDGAIYLRFHHQGYHVKIWDHAAGCIVVTEAGGVVTDAAGNPLDFSIGKHLDLEKGIIVTSKKLMPLLLNAVQEVLKEQS